MVSYTTKEMCFKFESSNGRFCVLVFSHSFTNSNDLQMFHLHLKLN